MVFKVSQTSDKYAVADEQRSEFAANGHVLLRGVAGPDTVARYRPAIRRACLTLSTETRPIEERDTYGKAFLQTMNLWLKDETIKEFVLQPRFAAIAADLLDVEQVRLYHDQALFKEADGGPTPWHQDQYYWPLDTDRTVTMWMPLVDITPEMGILTFASGSHSRGLAGSLAISDESESELAQYVLDNQFPISMADHMAAGDATFHLGMTIHSAGENRSPLLREVMTVIYFADGAKVSTPANQHQQADLAAWLAPRQPGETADGPLNPLIN